MPTLEPTCGPPSVASLTLMDDLPASVSLTVGAGGLPTVEVSCAHGQATVYLHGATVTSWIPAGHDPVLWLSPVSSFASDRPIRGGIPLCLPWFGTGPQGNQEPLHGTARISRWDVTRAVDDGGVTLEFALTEPGWDAVLTITVAETLGLRLTTHNTGAVDLPLEEALHTYFAVRDVTAIAIRGLDGARYFDKVGRAFATLEEDLRLRGQTDRVFDSRGPVEIVDPGYRTIRVTKEHSATTVVWNPWDVVARSMADIPDDAWPGFVCVETANVGAAGLRLAPGESHTIATRYEVIRH